MEELELYSLATELFNYIKSQPSIDDKQTVILNKQKACIKFNIEKEDLEKALILLCPDNIFLNNDKEDVNLLLYLDLNPNSLNEIKIRWRIDPFHPFL